MQETQTYQCIQPVRFNGKSYALGADIDLTDEEAVSLKASGAIAADDDTASALDVGNLIDSTLDVAANLEATLLNVSLETANNKVETLTGELATANSKVTQLTTDLASANSRADQLSGDLSAANSKFSQLTGDLGAANSNIEQLRNELTAEKAKTAILTDDLAKANANIAAQPKAVSKKTEPAK